jgi:predicted ABC-type ATPase
MSDPVLHLIAGPNGAGKSTLYERVIGPVTHLAFVNADLIALDRWPDDPERHAYDAAELAAKRRTELIDMRASFVAETVFSHESKLDVIRAAQAVGYVVTVHVVMVPVDLAVARVKSRIAVRGHAVPEDKIRSRYGRLWPLVAEAITLADHAVVYDNSTTGHALREVAAFQRGAALMAPAWPAWTPPRLQALTASTAARRSDQS